ncbi:MAG: polyprenyl synthetase family protein [Planctomycetota bacterium]
MIDRGQNYSVTEVGGVGSEREIAERSSAPAARSDRMEGRVEIGGAANTSVVVGHTNPSVEKMERSSVAARPTAPAMGTSQNSEMSRHLAEVERLIRRALSSRYESVDELCTYASSMGGKRLRPRLTILCAEALGHVPEARLPDVYRAASAVELVHAASLVHDDVMDDADIRRHKPTIGRLAGSSAAILLGDYLFTKAYALAAMCRSRQVAVRIADAATALCEGELRQQLMSRVWETSVRDYRSVLQQKTGALCAVSCYLGARTVVTNRQQLGFAKQLYHFGMRLGLAFQIYDDWLDYWGTDQVGKTLATDLKQQKPTLPLLRLLETSTPPVREELVSLLTGETEHEAKLSRVLEFLGNSDASEYTLRVAKTQATRAMECLEPLADSPSVKALKQLAEFSVQRRT